MKAIHISNARRRDAEVGIEPQPPRTSLRTVLPDGRDKVNVKILKNTLDQDLHKLTGQYGEDLHALADALQESDPEVDIETAGRFLSHTHKLYIDADDDIAYRLNLYQVVIDREGNEIERRDLNRAPANVNSEIPLRWTGVKFGKDEASRRFVFSRNYQIRHINGVTFDFLYNMAKQLDEEDALVLVGAGTKGTDPILLSRGGSPYRGFLEGRVEDERYCLILHLSDTELKGGDNGDI